MPLKEWYATHDPGLCSVPVMLHSTPTLCLPRQIIPGARESVLLAQVDRGVAIIYEIIIKFT